MDPQLRNILTSVLMSLFAAATAWGVARGYIPSADASSFTNDLVTVALGLITTGVGWWGSTHSTTTAMIKQINSADNGVKVVAESSTGAPKVDAPAK